MQVRAVECTAESWESQKETGATLLFLPERSIPKKGEEPLVVLLFHLYLFVVVVVWY